MPETKRTKVFGITVVNVDGWKECAALTREAVAGGVGVLGVASRIVQTVNSTHLYLGNSGQHVSVGRYSNHAERPHVTMEEWSFVVNTAQFEKSGKLELSASLSITFLRQSYLWGCFTNRILLPLSGRQLFRNFTEQILHER
jgi:hypothetical protein